MHPSEESATYFKIPCLCGAKNGCVLLLKMTGNARSCKVAMTVGFTEICKRR